MQRRRLGASNLEVSELGLGTMTFGRECDATASRTLLDAYLEAGGNFLDTADVYGERGGSEVIVGQALAGRRDDVVIATKGRMAMSDSLDDRGATPGYLRRAVEASLRRLGTDRIDLYLIHWPDPTVRAEDTFGALDDLVRAGKLRYYGVSNYLGSMLQRAIDVCEFGGLGPVVAHQVQYSLLHREVELETLPQCVAQSVGVVAWGPLGGGVITGKYRADEPPPPDTRLAAGSTLARVTDRSQAIAAELAAVAAEIGRTPAQVALNWVLHRVGVSSALIGARTVAQLTENLAGAGWRLDPELEARLEAASATPLPYPQSTYELLNIARYGPPTGAA